jgi:hypothetical protein
MLGVAGGALLVLAERAQDAQAQTLDPPAAPTISAVPPLDLPPVTAPPTPAPPPVPEPALPPTPNVPPALPLPAPTFPTPPAVAAPEVPGPVPPVVLPSPDVPGAPAAPGIPGIDPGRVNGTVGPLPDVPEVPAPAPEATLPDLPELPDPAVPLDGLLDLSAAPPPAAPAPANAPDVAPSVTVPDAAPSRIALVEARGLFADIDIGSPPARGPPTDAPGSPHPCPGGGSTHPTRADPAALLPPGADDASRRAGLLAEARAYASALLRDPLLRPD